MQNTVSEQTLERLISALESGEWVDVSELNADQRQAFNDVRCGDRIRKITEDYLSLYIALLRHGPSSNGYVNWSCIHHPPAQTQELSCAPNWAGFYSAPDNRAEPSDFSQWSL